MKNFGIQEPCSENWANMTPTDKGAFCQQCSKQVIDFTNKSTDAIKAILLKNKNESLCGRMTIQQEVELQNDFALWQQSSHQQMRRISLYAFILVFGLSIVSCADEQDKQTIDQLHQSTIQMLDNVDKNDTPIVVSAGTKTENTKEMETSDIEVIECHTMGQIVSIKKDSSAKENIRNKEINIHERLEYTMLGAMVSTSYLQTQYLEATVDPTRYDENGIAIPTAFSAVAYPNPTKDNTTLKFEVPEKVKASIMLYDMNGTLVREIEARKFDAGTYNLSIDLTDEVTGTYLIYVVSKEFKESLRVVKIE